MVDTCDAPGGALCTAVGWHGLVPTLGDTCECKECGGEGVRRLCFTLDPRERATVLVCAYCRHCRRCDGRGALLVRSEPPFSERPWDRDTATEAEHITWCPSCCSYAYEPGGRSSLATVRAGKASDGNG
jgi:hypothetical protein